MACIFSNWEGGGSPGMSVRLAQHAPEDWQTLAETQLCTFMPPDLQAQLPIWARNYLLAKVNEPSLLSRTDWQ